MKAIRSINLAAALFIFSLGLSNDAISQATVPGNNSGAPAYLGWNSTSPIALIIQNKDPQPINFGFGLSATRKFTIEPSGRFSIPNPNATFATDFISMSIAPNYVRGINISLDQPTTQNTVVGFAVEMFNSGSTQRGIVGESIGIPTLGAIENYGIWAFCIGQTSGAWGRSVWGKADPLCNNGGELAAQFDGDVFTTDLPVGPSDINLKENIAEVDNEDLNNLLLIEPKTYYFDPSIEVMNLPEELQYGVLSQNVDSIFPSFTRRITHPSDWDPAENVIIHESIQYMGLAYNQFIALLVAGWQQQNGLIENQTAEIATLTDEVEQLESEVLAKSNSNKLKKSAFVSEFRIYPNPVQNILNTEVVFEEEQIASIILYDINMRKVDTLLPSTQLMGKRTYQFDLSNHPDGYYFIVLETEAENFVLKLKH